MRSRPKLTCLLLSLLLLLSGCAGDAAGSPARITLPGQRQAAAPLTPGTKPSWPPPDPIVPYDYTLCFAGDVSLAGGSAPASALAARGLEGCFSPELLEAMAGADVMCLNSEFAFTDRGEPLAGKTYTFRADPALVSTYQEMGVDLAVLANNHVFDFGEAGLQDTLDTFRAAGLPYVGAGENLDEASAVWYAELEGCTVAYVAGSRMHHHYRGRGRSRQLFRHLGSGGYPAPAHQRRDLRRLRSGGTGGGSGGGRHPADRLRHLPPRLRHRGLLHRI